MTAHSITSKALCWLVLLGSLSLGIWSCSSEEAQTPRVLVFSKTAGYRHASIEAGIAALQALGIKHQFQVDTTEDADAFREENLKNYHAVIFLNTTGDVLNHAQQNDFERFVQAGGGYVGIHAATDTEYDWPWYTKLSGAQFESHPNDPNVLKGTFRVVDKTHPSTRTLPDLWEREDEFYNFKNLNPEVRVLVNIDEKSYQGGTNGDHHPMSWYHDYDGGRAFYTNMGHTDETFSEPLVLEHLLGGIQYAIGGEKPVKLDYARAHTLRVPEENRFTKVVLAQKLGEPFELAVLDKGKVLLIERKGAVKLYDPATQQVKTIAQIAVSNKYLPKDGKQKEAEDGLMGLAADPNFSKNHWVYLYYSPAGDEAKNVLARYELKGDELDMSSEEIMLEVPVQRQECCHTGGSIAFDAQGNLYLSTGDNTNPFDTGYAPIDERPDRSAWDAQKSSANTNDLRGKILRIRPEADGSYTIPEGNLFAKGTPKTRPEIYTMGHRNPFRIAVDKKTGFVYWGDVGPDANKDTLTAGPRGHDEFNQARKPGNFGWPHFIGDNKPYVDYDFASGKGRGNFDPAKPINNSPHNTGLQELPAAQPAFIWYPYDASAEFPLVGAGGRTAMAGPVYRKEFFKNAKRSYPEYYDGKWLIYEWMRGWIMVVTMDKEGNFVSMEPFIPSQQFSNPMDMEFGPEGDLYMLEYGEGWFQDNDNARLVRIEYNGGNRAPEVKLAADQKIGDTPLQVNFSSAGTNDPDRDVLSYEWQVKKDGKTQQSAKEPNAAFTFDKPGIYTVSLQVTDAQGAKSSQSTEIMAGNTPPKLSFNMIRGNRTFYFPGQSFEYEVAVEDKEDGSLAGGGITASEVALTIDYLKEGFDKVAIAQGHREADASVAFAHGKKLMDGSDCKACHAVDKKSIGPTYQDIARKYQHDPKAVDLLANKIIQGGGGVWGEAVMAAHPQIAADDAKEIVRYILSLGGNEKAVASLPVKGAFSTTIPADAKGSKGVFITRVAYADKGAKGLPSARAEEVLVLRYPEIEVASADFTKDIQKYKMDEPPVELVIAQAHDSYIGFDNLDLTGIEQLEISVVAPIEYINATGGKIEVRLGSANGKLLGETALIVPSSVAGSRETPKMPVALTPVQGQHPLYLVFKSSSPEAQRPLFTLTTVAFRNKKQAQAVNAVTKATP